QSGEVQGGARTRGEAQIRSRAHHRPIPGAVGGPVGGPEGPAHNRIHAESGTGNPLQAVPGRRHRGPHGFQGRQLRRGHPGRQRAHPDFRNLRKQAGRGPAPGTRTAAQGERFPGAFLYHHHQGHQGAGVRHEPAIVPDRARVFLHHSGLEPRLAGGEPEMKRIALALAVLAAAHGAAPAQAPSAIKPEYAVLENGMKVILYPDRHAPTVACRLFYVTGSVHEHAGTSGIAHLLEHMLFKGTKKVGVKDVEKDAEYVQRIDALMARRRTLAPKDSLEDKALMRRYDSLITE